MEKATRVILIDYIERYVIQINSWEDNGVEQYMATSQPVSTTMRRTRRSAILMAR